MDFLALVVFNYRKLAHAKFVISLLLGGVGHFLMSWSSVI